MSAPNLSRARELIDAARRVVVLTGAGVSAESGVPTFRGPGGLWKAFRPEELATPEAFARDPGLVWEWYAWRRGLVGACDPNPAHEALGRLALDRQGEVTLVTQNVDGLHHRAARAEAYRRAAAGRSTQPDAAFPLEVHGALHRDRCSGCGRHTEGVLEVDTSSRDTLPHCAECRELLRPDVVWFGEALDPEVIGAAFDAARHADLCLVAGTSAVVYPVASLPEITLQAAGDVIEVNLEATPLTASATVSLFGQAGDLLPQLLG